MAPAPGRRSALPTLLVTMFLLLAVLATLWLTGAHHGKPAQFGLSLNTPVVTVTAGDTISTTLTVSAQGNFRGVVTLSAPGLPAGLVAEFDPPTVTVTDAHPSATAILRLHTTQVLTAGPLGVSVIATAGSIIRNSVVQLQIQPDGTLSSAPAPVPNPTSIGFSLSGGPAEALAPGRSVPIDMHLNNDGSAPVSVSSISISVAGTSRPGCGAANFALTQYTGRYPLQLPARSKNTLSSLGIARSSWPTLAMLNLPVNQDDCKGVTVHLRYAGSGTGT